jgi:hypothetical protein
MLIEIELINIIQLIKLKISINHDFFNRLYITKLEYLL